MEKFTAYLEATPYSWLTLLTVALGAVVALLTIRAGRRRYPALFRRRRSFAVLVLLLISALSIPASIFLPGAPSFPSLRSLLLFVIPGVLIWAGVFRFPAVGAPLVLLFLGLLLWSEGESTRSYLFPEAGEQVAFFEVREAGEERLDLFAEFPPVAGRRFLEEGVDYSFPLSLSSSALTVEGEMVVVHPYLWWRLPSVGARITGFQGSTGTQEPFVTLSERSERVIGILEWLSLLRRSSWRASIPSEDLLLARYELTLREREPALVRSGSHAD